jgi:SAM-dependent methyltransferase
MKITDLQFQTLLRETTAVKSDYGVSTNSVSNSVKNFLKRWPWLFNFLKKAIGPAHSPGNRYNLRGRINKIFGGRIGDKIVLNLGSGTIRIHPEVINVDIFAFKNVDIVADIKNMPFRDTVADGVVCDDVLEHVPDTAGVLREISRILKPGGTFILTVPFMYPYHSSPDDYFRWTEEGIRHILKENNFNIEELGIRGGPMGALQGLLMHILATIFSFGSKTAYFFLTQFFMALLSPLKLLDPLLMLFPYSIEVAGDIFIIARKNN